MAGGEHYVPPEARVMRRSEGLPMGEEDIENWEPQISAAETGGVLGGPDGGLNVDEKDLDGWEKKATEELEQ